MFISKKAKNYLTIKCLKYSSIYEPFMKPMWIGIHLSFIAPGAYFYAERKEFCTMIDTGECSRPETRIFIGLKPRFGPQQYIAPAPGRGITRSMPEEYPDSGEEERKEAA
jgi:hypothetical protein